MAGTGTARMRPLRSLGNTGASGCWRTGPPGCGLFCPWVEIGSKGVGDSGMATPPETWGTHCTLFITRIKLSRWWSFLPKVPLLEFVVPFSVHTSYMANRPFPQGRWVYCEMNPDGTKWKEGKCSAHLQTKQNKGCRLRATERRTPNLRPCAGSTGRAET